jgi:hypothetical protein
MSTIDQFSDEQLEAELERIEQVRNAPPAPLENPDFSSLVSIAKEKIRTIVDKKDVNTNQFFYEEVMEAVYGYEIFDWINEHGNFELD